MTLLYAYNFDEASGNIVDQSGNGRDTVLGGSLTRTSSGAGHTDKGMSQSTTAADSNGPSLTGLQTAEFTVMCWVKRSSNSQDGWIAEFKASGSGDRGILFLSSAVQARARNSGGTVVNQSTAQPTAGTWYHVAATYSTTDSKVHLFINGVESGTGAALTGPLKTTSATSSLFDGLGAETIIDDVRYYDTALDASTITTLMGTPVTGGGTTGTVAVTQASDTSSASGQLGYSGTSARTQANQTSSASGQLGYSGTSARTQANQTSTASGTFTAGGSFSGTVAVTQAANTSSASGTFTPGSVTGSAAIIQANQTSAATGKLGYSGTLARLQANNVSVASGVVSGPVAGSVAVVQANQIAAAVGQFAALVSFGTSSAGVGTEASSHPNEGLAPFSAPAAAAAPSASGVSIGVPTSTGA